MNLLEEDAKGELRGGCLINQGERFASRFHFEE